MADTAAENLAAAARSPKYMDLAYFRAAEPGGPNIVCTLVDDFGATDVSA